MHDYLIELRHCPFCGGDAELIQVYSFSPYKDVFYTVQCKNCGCNSGNNKLKRNSVKKWNRRTSV